MTKRLLLSIAALALLAGAVAPAEAYGRRGGRVHWGVGIGIGIGLPLYGAYAYPYAYPAYAYPAYGYPVYSYPAPAPDAYQPVPAAPAAKAAPDPIFYPRNGQSAAQTEADRQACNTWATTQPNAMADASVFHRATLACMEGRGYTVR